MGGGRGISPQDVPAFGDNENDAAMLAALERPAGAQAKEAARKILGDANSGAIAEAVGIRLGEGAGRGSPLFE